MKIDIDFSDYSRRFLFELAETTKNPGVLTKIVDFAIKEDNYEDFVSEEGDGTDYYLEACADNECISEKDMAKILRYKGSPHSRWGIIERKDLSIIMIDIVARTEEDFSLIGLLLKKHESTILDQLPETREKIAETIARRIIKGKITIGDCVMNEFNPGHRWFEADEIENVIKKLSELCNAETARKLDKWLEQYK